MLKDDPGRRVEQFERRGAAFKWAALVLTIVTVGTATGFLLGPRLLQSESRDAPATQKPQVAAPPLFRNWPQPDVALVLSGEEHGYLQPCGCSDPQKGGLARRYNFVQTLVQRGWPIVLADLGDVPQRSGPQALLKYRVSMQALKQLGYTAVGVGEHEMLQPLFNALGEYALNEHTPRVLAANLLEKEKNFPDMVAATKVSSGANGAPKVGFIGIVAPSVAKKTQDPDVRFEPVQKALPVALQAIQAEKPELLVLLYQGSVAEAKAIAKDFQQFQVILCLSEHEEPSSQPDLVGTTIVVAVGQKGRYIGVVGGKRTGNPSRPFDLHYQLVPMGPEYETPAGQDQKNPIHALLQKYAEEVKKDNYLAKYLLNAQHPVQIAFPKSTYVGSDKCKKCHGPAYDIWKDSPHPHAYEALVQKAKRPTLRQYDGECVGCHVIGFGYESGFTDEVKTPLLKGVGCESCHGPASLHVADHKNLAYQAALNPWKANVKDRKKVIDRIDSELCQKCHDQDNDVNYNFEKYWEPKKIAHYTAGNPANPAPPNNNK
jgi:hypothetical protein